jgi:hypothetical protein
MVDAPLPLIVEELAHAVVADRRAGRTAPPALLRYIDLFAPDLPISSQTPSTPSTRGPDLAGGRGDGEGSSGHEE